MQIPNIVEAGLESNFTNKMMKYVIEMAKWARFISIVCFCCLFVFAIYALGLIFPDLNGLFTHTQHPLLGVIYLIITFVTVIPNWKLMQFSKEVLNNKPEMNNHGIENAFAELKFIFKFYGILIIILLLNFLLFVTKTVLLNFQEVPI